MSKTLHKHPFRIGKERFLALLNRKNAGGKSGQAAAKTAFFGLDKPSRVLGIDIDDTVVRIVELSRSSEGINLSNCLRLDLGSIMVEEAASRTKEILSKANILSSGGGSLAHAWVISNPRVILRPARIRSVDPAEIAKMVIFEAEKNIPVETDELWIDHQILKTEVDCAQVLISAVKRKEIDGVFSFCSFAGIPLEAVGICSLASLNWLVYNRGDIGGYIVLVDIRAQSINTTYCQDLVPLSTESVSLAKEETTPSPQAKRILSEIEKSLKLLPLGLKENIGKLFISGKGARDVCRMPELARFSPEYVSVGDKVVVPADIARQFCLEEFVPAFGLALWGLGEARYNLDLYPDDRRKREQDQKRRRRFIAGGLVVGAVAVIAAIILFIQAMVQGKAFADLSRRVAAKRKPAEEARRVLDYRTDSYGLVNFLMENLTGAISLSEIEFTQGKFLEISGFAAEHVALYDLKKKIEGSIYARKHGLTNVRILQAVNYSQGRIQFRLRCDYPGGGAADETRDREVEGYRQQ